VNDDQAAFVERMGRSLTEAGLPRMAGRMWAWLLICEPPEQSAAEVAEALHASRGAISGAARLLTAAGLIHRTTRRGDRREFYSVPPGSMTALMRAQGPATAAQRRIAEEGLALLADRTNGARDRLEEVRDLYVFMERELPALIDRFEAERRGARAAREGTT
jgi:DNA-binding transcriptional regulator GbsR (MarR family)